MKLKIKDDFDAKLKKALYNIGNKFMNVLIETCPVDKGTLKNSINFKMEEEKIVIEMNETGVFVEFGTPPHTIRAKDAKALHWKSGGKDIFAKVVNHPGTRPNPFIRNAINTKLPDIVTTSIDEAFK